MQKFYKDLKGGQKWEKRAVEYFDYDKIKWPPEGKHSAYDFKLYHGTRIHRVEVKSDKMAHKTGNIAVEWFNHGAPSGISISRARYYVFFTVLPRSHPDYRKGTAPCYIIPTDELKKMCKGARKVAGGDDYKSKMYLIRVRDIRQYLAKKKRIAA